MKTKSIKRNFIYNLILTFANMCFPLVTAPYLSEILGASGLGKVNYSTAIINWFILGASFGIPRFAVREVAKFREDKRKLSNLFWNLIIIQIFLTVSMLFVYGIMILSIPQFYEEILLYLITALVLLFNIFSLDWFYQGIEEYGYITTRNVLVKSISLIFIFVFINKPSHYILYAGINVLVVVVNNIVNFLHSLNYIKYEFTEIKPLYYLKQLKVFFFIALVVAMYTQLDQVFLGSISESELAYYVRSRAILNIGLSLTTALVTVLSPRAAYLAYNNWNEYKKLIQKSVNYIYLLGIPVATGIFLLSTEAIYFLGGSEFAPASLALKIIAPLSLISILGSWVSGQILIPNKMETKSFNIQCVSVVLSVGLNLILIPSFSYIGAAITWLTVETFLFITKAIYANLKCRGIKVHYFNRSLFKFLIGTFLMTISVLSLKSIISSEIITLFVSSSMGAIIYFITLLVLKEETVITILNEIRVKINKC